LLRYGHWRSTPHEYPRSDDAQPQNCFTE
jgi:hypothetical protein